MMKRVAILVRFEVEIELFAAEDVIVGLVSVDDPNLGLGILIVFEDGSEDLKDGSDAWMMKEGRGRKRVESVRGLVSLQTRPSSSQPVSPYTFRIGKDRERKEKPSASQKRREGTHQIHHKPSQRFCTFS